MGVPVVLLGEGLVDAVVEVLVVREDDMAADVVELDWGGPSWLARGCQQRREETQGAEETHEAFRSNVCAGKTTSLVGGVNDHP